MGQTLYDKLWDSHVVHVEEDGTALLYIDRHLVHEVTSPQAYEGLRAAGRKPWRIDSVVATADHNTPTTDWDEGIEGVATRSPSCRSTTLDANMREFGAKVYFPYPRQAPGHRPRHRPGAGRDAARHDGGVRRFAHQHARRVRLPGARHRHLGSRARARHAVPDAAKDEEHAGQRRRPARPRRHREGRSARHHRPHRHRRRHRLRGRVRRQRDPRAVDGRPHDGLQHGDRSRRARRHDRRGRHHDAVPQGPAVRAQRRETGIRRWRIGAR